MLEQIYANIKSHYGIDDLVFGEGRQNADIMLIGEAPGKDEVREKRPFCGKAGQNLNEFLEVLQLKREDIFISNVCKFRPFKVSEKGSVRNRPPTGKEVEEALPLLYREIEAVAPKCIVTLGNTPLRACLGNKQAVIGNYHGRAVCTSIRGKDYPLFALYHPASIIYNPALKQTYAADLQQLQAYIQQLHRKLENPI